MFLAHLNSLQASIFSSLAIVSLLLTFVMLGSHWLRNYVYAFAVAILADCCALRGRGLFRGLSRTLCDRGAHGAFSRPGVAVSADAHRRQVACQTRNSCGPPAEFQPCRRGLSGDVRICDRQPYESADYVCAHVVVLALTIMLSMKFIGFLMLSVRDEAVSQILGLLVLENGIFLGSQILVPGMPLLIEIVILFDLLIVVACFGMLVRFLVVHAGTTSSRELNRLVG